jgi:predicted amidophosphoribosyltransferase
MESGPAELCYACALRTIESLAPEDQRCHICDRPYATGESLCRNPLCNSFDQRWFARNYSIGMRSGVLQYGLNRYKYEGKWGWAIIFGRILAGYLEQEADLFQEFDLLVASPTYVGPGGRTFDHTRRVLQHTAEELVFAPIWFALSMDVEGQPAIIKTSPTPSLMPLRYAERRHVAETELRNALHVPDPSRTRGKSILVYDDVFTDGTTMSEVARALRVHGGAALVCGITLCRQPWRGG